MVKRAVSVLMIFALIFATAICAAAARPESADLKVIDLSHWNIISNWDTVAREVDGVILKIGYRGTSGRRVLAEDEKFASFYQNAVSRSIPVGCYFFSGAFTVEEAVQEAEWVINKIETYNCKFDMPIYYDMELLSQERQLTTRQRTDIIAAFCKTLKDRGFYPGVYTNTNWLTWLLYPSDLQDYTIWVAQYASACSYTGTYDMWQYTGQGTVNGIATVVDISRCYRNFPKFIRENGYNRFSDSPVISPAESVDTSRLGTYKVTVNALNVRLGPNASYSSLGTLAQNAQVFVYDYSGDWGKISFAGQTGWILLDSAYVKKTSDVISKKTGVGFYDITADVLNIRAGKGTDTEKIGKLYQYDRVFLTTVSDGWGKLYFGNGNTGWICMDYAAFVGTVFYANNNAVGGMTPQFIKKGETAKLKKCTLSAAGGIFLGWSKTKGGTVAYQDEASVKMGSSNLVLYPVFFLPLSVVSGSRIQLDMTNMYITVPDLRLTKSQFINQIVLPAGISITVTPVVANRIGTGTVVKLKQNGAVISTLTVVVSGDSTGDGICDGLDLADALALAQGTKPKSAFTAAQRKALDVTGDGRVTTADVNKIKKAAFGTGDLL